MGLAQLPAVEGPPLNWHRAQGVCPGQLRGSRAGLCSTSQHALCLCPGCGVETASTRLPSLRLT